MKHIENIVIIVSDNAANIKKTNIEAFGVDKHLPWFAYTLNLVPVKIIDENNVVKNFCSKIKDIVTYF